MNSENPNSILLNEEVEKKHIGIINENVVPIQQHPVGCIYYLAKVIHSRESILSFAPKELNLQKCDYVVVMTRYGKDLAQILSQKALTPTDEAAYEIFRKATEQDHECYKANLQKAKQAFKICQQKIAGHNLEMKLVSTHYLLEEAKILFFFTAENRVDFRELVKDLVSFFKTRIELRQIGVRDEARVIGGLGICGRIFCCHSVTDHLNPVSIKMAKEQNISLNSLKISGPCGRLLCCLGYEFDFYHNERSNLPQEGMEFKLNNEKYKIIEINVLVKAIKLQAESGAIVCLPFDLFYKDEKDCWHIQQDLYEEINFNV